MKVGQCIHLDFATEFVCTQGKYQNYPCPYRNNIKNCPCSMPITTEMAEQWKEKGYILIPVKEI